MFRTETTTERAFIGQGPLEPVALGLLAKFNGLVGDVLTDLTIAICAG